MEVEITLPKYVFEDGIGYLICILFRGDIAEKVTLDFQEVKYYTPIGVTTILATLQLWIDSGKSIDFKNLDTCAALKYLQRMDFFHTLGLKIGEDFNRHHPSGYFLPVEKIGGSEPKNTTKLITELVAMIPVASQSNDIKRLIEYSLGEIINNCVQHSVGVGFVSAQYAAKTDFLRIAISDNGIGIRESFYQNNSPFFREALTDANFLELALRVEVSSKTHMAPLYGQPANHGVGLTMVSELCKDTIGYFVLGSGNALLSQDGSSPTTATTYMGAAYYKGTICSLAFRLKDIHNFQQMMHDSKLRVGLIKESLIDKGGIFL